MMREVTMRRGATLGVLVGVLAMGGAMSGAQAPQGPGTTSGTPVAPNAGSVSGSKRAEAGTTTDTGRVGVSVDDPTFVNRAIMNDHGVIDISKLALQKGTSDKVKQVAQTVVSTHQQMLDQLKQVAGTAGLKYRDSASPLAKQMYQKLQGLSGAEFDKAYLQTMLRAHQEELRLFRDESQNGKVEPLMKLSAEQLETIKQHLQELQGVVKGM